eukprot:1901911-Prymnesium_polylepis.1
MRGGARVARCAVRGAVRCAARYGSARARVVGAAARAHEPLPCGGLAVRQGVLHRLHGAARVLDQEHARPQSQEAATATAGAGGGRGTAHDDIHDGGPARADAAEPAGRGERHRRAAAAAGRSPRAGGGGGAAAR